MFFTSGTASKTEKPAKSSLWMALPVLAFCAILTPSDNAYAQACESPGDASSDFSDLAHRRGV